MVFQSYALWPHMSVQRNVAYGLGVRKVSRADQATRAAQALAEVRMESLATRKPNQLSGGQQQRVALARALVVRPDVLLLDEPLSNLDARLRVQLRSEIRRTCKNAGITTVYVTHDQKEALSMADRIAVLDAGRIAQLGTPGEIYRQPASRFVAEFMGEPNLVPATAGVAGPGQGVRLETVIGPLVSSHSAAAGGRVLAAIRPESVRIVDAGDAGGPMDGNRAVNTFHARVEEAIYLGEIVQYLVSAGPTEAKVMLRVSHLNPGARPMDVGAILTLAVSPEDVVIVPEA
jgi:iron(III) transport system ATP-binding protein